MSGFDPEGLLLYALNSGARAMCLTNEERSDAVAVLPTCLRGAPRVLADCLVRNLVKMSSDARRVSATATGPRELFVG